MDLPSDVQHVRALGADDEYLFVSADRLYRSQDLGQTWLLLSIFAANPELPHLPVHDSVVQAFSSDPWGAVFSEDYGDTWEWRDPNSDKCRMYIDETFVGTWAEWSGAVSAGGIDHVSCQIIQGSYVYLGTEIGLARLPISSLPTGVSGLSQTAGNLSFRFTSPCRLAVFDSDQMLYREERPEVTLDMRGRLVRPDKPGEKMSTVAPGVYIGFGRRRK